MLRRALRRARLHLPASSVGQEDGEQPVELGDGAESASVAHTSLAFDAAVDEHFRRQSEDVEGLEDLLRALRRETKAQRRSSIESVGDEAQRAADAWTRLQRLYGLFQAMADDEVEPSRPPGRDQGLRSLLSEPAREPAGVMLRDLRVLPRETQPSVSASPPQGFSAEVFLSLGDALYAEMLEASSTKQQHRFDHDALRELGDTLYAEAASQSVVPVSAC